MSGCRVATAQVAAVVAAARCPTARHLFVPPLPLPLLLVATKVVLLSLHNHLDGITSDKAVMESCLATVQRVYGCESVLQVCVCVSRACGRMRANRTTLLRDHAAAQLHEQSTN